MRARTEETRSLSLLQMFAKNANGGGGGQRTIAACTYHPNHTKFFTPRRGLDFESTRFLSDPWKPKFLNFFTT